ncbi:hypothetical protein SPPR111872_00110 [Sphingobacterium prati]
MICRDTPCRLNTSVQSGKIDLPKNVKISDQSIFRIESGPDIKSLFKSPAPCAPATVERLYFYYTLNYSYLTVKIKNISVKI